MIKKFILIIFKQRYTKEFENINVEFNDPYTNP